MSDLFQEKYFFNSLIAFLKDFEFSLSDLKEETLKNMDYSIELTAQNKNEEIIKSKIYWDKGHKNAMFYYDYENTDFIKMMLDFLFDALGIRKVVVIDNKGEAFIYDAFVFASERKPSNKQIKVVALAFFDKEQKLLMAQRPKNKKMQGLWEFPGGKVNQEEEFETAIIREIKEELNTDISKEELIMFDKVEHRYSDFDIEMTLFVIKNCEKELIPQEGQKIKWFDLNDINYLPMPLADVPLVNKILLNFSD